MTDPIEVRSYGSSGPPVFVLHGGPAAPGEARPIALGLARSFRAFEPLQRGSGSEPLTVARHVEDLRHAIERHAGFHLLPALVGESWGAMLALAFAASHPEAAGPIVLVGCGTFDRESRAAMKRILEERTTPELRRRLERLEEEVTDPGERLIRKYECLRPLYDFDPIEDSAKGAPGLAPGAFDRRAHEETWEDMLRLQEAGVYPAAFSAVRSPVLMLHGAFDPHPGGMIRHSLAPYIARLEYRELERCGHSPWRERHARAEFFTFLEDWLGREMGRS